MDTTHIRRGVIAAVAALSMVFGTLAAGQAQDGSLVKPVGQSAFSIQVETLATGLTAPNWGTSAPGDGGRLFVSDQDGILWAVDLASGDKAVFADLSGLLVPLGAFGPGTFDERGFLGVAFDPGYASNGRLYTYTSEPFIAGSADFSTMPSGSVPNHQTVIREWAVPNPANPASVVDPTSVRELLRVDQPQFNHNGGAIGFGRDGMLYIALGDGGGRDDEGIGHATGGNGQDPSNVLGSILRIDPAGTDSANGQYGIPGDNPFVGIPDHVEEIFAHGFRNPFRFSFDRATGDLYAADVGQDDIEEVDVVVAGGNYGWPLKEGAFCFDRNGAGPGFAFDDEPCPGVPPGLIDPVAQYNTADSLDVNFDGRAVVGGFVYRGDDIPGLAGRYVFGDFSRFTDSGVNNDGSLFFLNKKNIVKPSMIKESKVVEFTLFGQERLGLSVLGFGEDAAGELYVLANDTGVPFGDTGVVLRITKG